jgi:3-methylcrotonyl-CoA carboxylase alpha subunit
VGERSYQVEQSTDGRVVLADGEAFDIRRLGPGTYRIGGQSRSWVVYIAGAAAAPSVFIDGEVFELEVLERVDGRRSGGGSELGALSAPMPATVAKILVAPGRTVTRGEPLLILDAMKMELSIRAPRDGVITAIRCAEGDLVQPGIPLLELL